MITKHEVVDAKYLESLIKEALKKLKVSKENNICPYIPIPTGGHIHHFTMKKMRIEAPQQLAAMISQHIISVEKPIKVSPKKRAPRGSRKSKDKYIFSAQELEKLRVIARLSGDKEMINKLAQKRDMLMIKRDLIASIRQDKISEELWQSYMESIAVNNTKI